MGLKLSLKDVVNGAVGAFGPYCMGYMNPGASGGGYISTMKLSVDKVSTAGLDEGTEGIVSYDRCEKDDAYIGQINMGTASSFCGINGALWGYHLAKALSIADGSLQPMFTYPGPDYPKDDELPSQERVPVYPVGPLLDATVRLFGRMDRSADGEIDRRRFPPMPGAHVICANKDASARGPTYVWCAIAVAIAEDRNRDANLFIEDADTLAVDEGRSIETHLQETLHSVARSIVLCGQDQNVAYREIFTGAKYIEVGSGEWGCALTCAPYVVLAGDAVRAGGAARLLELDIRAWEEELDLEPLPPAPSAPGSGSVGC